MAIAVQCEQCGKRYSVGEQLAGKRVRCKNCAGVIAIPAQRQKSGDDMSDTVAAVPAVEETDLTFDEAPSSQPASASLAAPGGAFPGDGAPMIFQGAFRSSRQFNFPYAKEIDLVLPWVVVLGALTWLTVRAFDVSQSGRQWLDVTVFAVVLLLLAGIFWPIGLKALRMASQKMRYEMPSPAGWRVLAAYSLPVALLYALWTISESIGGLISGVLVGLLVTCSLVWLLIRPANRELQTTLIHASAAFLISTVLSIAAMLVINLLVLTILDGSGVAHEIRNGDGRSPFGPQLTWDATPPAPEKKPVIAWKPTPPTTSTSTTSPSDLPIEIAQPTTDTFDSIFAEVAEEADPTTQEVAGPIDTVDDPTVVAVDTAPDEPEERTTVKATVPADNPNAYVRRVVLAAGVKGFDEIIYPQLKQEWMLVIKRTTPTDDLIERWHVPTLTLRGQVRFNHEAGRRDRYIISPAGDYLVRIVNWPKLSAQVWSYEQRKVLRNISLAGRQSPPSLLDFVNDELFVVRWEKRGGMEIETFNVRTGGRVRPIPVPPHENIPSNFALSPNRRHIAIALRIDGAATLQMYDLGRGTPGRRMPINSLDRQWPVAPTGVQFSPDGLKVAILFEQAGNALIVVWRVDTGQAVQEFIYPSGMLPQEGGTTWSGAAFQWTSDGKAFLIYGRTLLDAETGATLHDLGIDQVVGQQTIDPSKLHIQTDSPQGKRLEIVELNPEKLRE